MIRTQISLTESERRTLHAESTRTGRSMSALIRDAIEHVYGAGHSAEDDLDAMRQARGSWRRDVDGADWVERMRPGRRLGHPE